MDMRFNIQKLQFFYKICLYVSHDSQGKQQLFHETAFTTKPLYVRGTVFTVWRTWIL